MQYLSYDEYIELGGDLSAADFDRFQFRAEREIDLRTYGRLKVLAQIPTEVKRCMFELIAYIAGNIADGSVRGKSSESNDGYSVSYANEQNADSDIYDIMYTYLADTDLMYRGVEV